MGLVELRVDYLLSQEIFIERNEVHQISFDALCSFLYIIDSLNHTFNLTIHVLFERNDSL